MNYFHHNYVFKISVNDNLEILSISSSLLDLLGYSSSDFLGAQFKYLLTERFQSIDLDLSSLQMVEIVSNLGALYHIEVILLEENGTRIIYGRDLSEYINAKLRMSRIEHYAQVGYWERFKDGSTVWSDEIFRIFEIDKLPGDNRIQMDQVTDCFSLETGMILGSSLRRIMLEGGEFELELEILTKKGLKKWIRTRGIAIEINGEVIRVEGMTQDVTSIRENVIQLLESQENLRFALAANSMGVWQLDLSNNKMNWDSNMCKVFGVDSLKAPTTVEEFFALIHPDDISRIKGEAVRAIKNHDTVVNSWFRVIVGDETRYIASRSEYKDESYYIGVNWDITKEKKAEELIRIQEANIISSARLSSLGEMAGGIAHEINNPLSVIYTRASQLKRRVLKNDFTTNSIVEGLAQIEKTCNRILKIITGLKTISRDGQKDPMDLICLQHCIEEVTSLVSERFKNNNMTLSITVPEKSIQIMGRFVQIEQVLMNLLNNSFDAICNLEKREMSISLIQRDNLAELRINDAGLGVPDSLRVKVFEPFFTTKEVGKGTGIGLSISRSIIEDHGGELVLVREPNSWYFRLSLPIVSP